MARDVLFAFHERVFVSLTLICESSQSIDGQSQIDRDAHAAVITVTAAVDQHRPCGLPRSVPPLKRNNQVSHKMRVFLALLVLISAEAFMVMPSTSRMTRRCLMAMNRRALLETALVTLAVPATPAMAVMLEEDYSSDFIQQLKSRSDGKEYSKDSGQIGPAKLSASKFSQQYTRPSFVSVRRSNRSIELVDSIKLKQLEETGKVVAKYETYLDKNGVERQDFFKGKVYFYVDS